MDNFFQLYLFPIFILAGGCLFLFILFQQAQRQWQKRQWKRREWKTQQWQNHNSEGGLSQGARPVPALCEQETCKNEQSETRALMNDLRHRAVLLQTSNLLIGRLSDKISDLERVLANKSARGTFGEQQMGDILKSILPSQLLRFQQTLSNGKRVDCLIQLPGPPGNLAVDSKFPLEAYQDYQVATKAQERKEAAQRFERHFSTHLKDIASKYIIPGETADQALMFLPSEAVFSCLHTDFRRLVELSHNLRVLVVSPSTFAGVLMALRTVFRDSFLSRNISVVRSEVDHLSKDLGDLKKSLELFDRHFVVLRQDLGTIQETTKNLDLRLNRFNEASLAGHKN